MLFYAPFSWATHNNLLEPIDGMKGRQKSTINLISRVEQGQLASKNLGFGNSQLGFIFGPKALKEHPEFDVVSIPGLRIAEYNFFADEIIDLKPERVILYLSDKTIAAKPDVSPLRVHPVNIIELLKLRTRMLNSELDVDNQMFVSTIIEELIYPHKYAFLLKAYAESYLLGTRALKYRRNNSKSKNKKNRKKAQNPDKSAIAEKQAEQQKKKKQQEIRRLLRRKKREFTEEHALFNLKELSSFHEKLSSESIDLIIVEGHYHPSVYNKHSEITKSVGTKLLTFAKERENVWFIPRSKLPKLVKEHYFDETHLNSGPSRKLFNSIQSNLETL